jgi:hypothetical protein
MKLVFYVMVLIRWTLENGDAKMDIVVDRHRVIAGDATCAKNRTRETHGVAIGKAREAHPDGKVEILCQQFGNC